MPTYCFTSSDGETIERTFAMKDLPPLVKEGGKVYRRDYSSEGVAVYMDADWSAENGGRGREITQLKDDLDAPTVYARDPSHAQEMAKKKGLSVEKA